MSRLYTPHLLSLAANLADYPFSDTLAFKAEARSRTCGSSIAIGFDLNKADGVSQIGMLVSACAIGQASAAILACSAKGKTPAQLASALNGLEKWLAGDAALPDWPAIDSLGSALDHPGRHGALLLPWQAAVRALSTEPLSSNPASR